MTGTALEPSDQPVGTPIAVNGAVLDPSAAAAKALLPAGSAAQYEFSAEWLLWWNGALITFRPGVGYALDAPLLAYLNAQSAPITAV